MESSFEGAMAKGGLLNIHAAHKNCSFLRGSLFSTSLPTLAALISNIFYKHVWFRLLLVLNIYRLELSTASVQFSTKQVVNIRDKYFDD